MVFKRSSCEGETVFRFERIEDFEPFRIVVFYLLGFIDDYRLERFLFDMGEIVYNYRIRGYYQLLSGVFPLCNTFFRLE